MKKSQVIFLGLVGVVLIIAVVGFAAMQAADSQNTLVGFAPKEANIQRIRPQICYMNDATGRCNVCGDGIRNIQSGEVCDGSSLGGQTCQTMGFSGGSLGCNAQCSGFVTSGCFTQTCTDSDGGVNFFTAGYTLVNISNGTIQTNDFCSGNWLTEYYCSGGYSLDNSTFCPGFGNYICQNGACVQNVTNQTYSLTVSKSGPGSGTVTSSPSGINCGGDCSENYLSGTSVTLTATPNSGSIFNGWMNPGSCAGTSGTCNVIMNSHRSAIAMFINSTNSTGGLPDLIITNLTVTNKTFTHSNTTGNVTYNFYKATFTATVKNIGTGNTGTSSTYFIVIGVPFAAGLVSTPGLAPGQSAQPSATLNNIAEGFWTVRADADALGVISELNEANNQYSRTFTVP